MHPPPMLTKEETSRTVPSCALQDARYSALNRNSRSPTHTGLRLALTTTAMTSLFTVNPYRRGTKIFGNSRCQKDDMKQVPHWEPTNIRFYPAIETEICPVLCCVICITCVCMYVGRHLLRAANILHMERRVTVSQQHDTSSPSDVSPTRRITLVYIRLQMLY